MKEGVSISDSEWVVMEAVWELKRPSAAEVIEHLDDTGWNHRTIRTLIARLVDKGHLSRTRSDNSTTYQALSPRSTCVRKEGASFLKRIFGGNANSLLMHFATQSKLSKEKLRQLEELLKDDD